ncbi:Peptidylprolyl isomerase [Sulfidibacter corallicola]|uniref:peptidylprolyl isomerase n=1 Tax=Sulfidibacter corallicola TaxID=2818388 RepID=A0A8A4U341_SULCO|nr:peptidylprolyl isomerase [Sulfidibacter corallicola]QTD53155.1 peptidylprolyl isomerase [Sulfidibacter corallicola]
MTLRGYSIDRRATRLLLVALFMTVPAWAKDLPPYFVKILQPRTLFAKNEPVPIIIRLGNQSERNLKSRKFPPVLESLVVTQGGERLALDPKYKSKDLFRKLTVLEMGNHKDFRLNIKRLFPAMAEGGVFSIGYKDDIYEHTFKNIQIAKVDLPPLDAHYVLETSKGDITLKLHHDQAPRHARNFAVLVAIGFYKNMIWHRVDKGFVIQTGDPLGTGEGGSNFSLQLETTPFLKNKKYSVGAARGNDRDSANSQFYVCLSDVSALDNDYTVFAEVIDGFEAVDAIGNVATTGSKAKPANRPLEEVALRDVKIKAVEAN